MTSLHVRPGETLAIQLGAVISFRRRCPDLFEALQGACVFVNWRRTREHEAARLHSRTTTESKDSARHTAARSGPSTPPYESSTMTVWKLARAGARGKRKMVEALQPIFIDVEWLHDFESEPIDLRRNFVASQAVSLVSILSESSQARRTVAGG